MAGEWFCYTGGRTGPSPVAEFPFAQFMVTIANAALWNDLESQREQELAEARDSDGNAAAGRVANR